MPPPPTQPPRGGLQSKPRRLHLVLRDGAEVEGGVFLNDGQALGPYLGSRKGGWVNLVGASWLVPVEEAVDHAVLQADHVLYAYAMDNDIPVHSVQGVVSVRHIEVTLSNDARIRGSLAIADRQRLSDFLHTVGKFIPIVGASRADTGELIGDVVLNHAVVRVLRDTAPGGRATTALETRGTQAITASGGLARLNTPPSSAAARPSTPPTGGGAVPAPRRASRMMSMETEVGAPPPRISAPVQGVRPSGPAPVVTSSAATPISGGMPAIPAAPLTPPERRAVTPPPSPAVPVADGEPPKRSSVTMRLPTGEYELDLPGPPVDRRSIQREAIRPSVRLHLEDDAPVPVERIELLEEVESSYSPAVKAIAKRVGRHWLSLVADRFGLSGADPRQLGADFTTEDIWEGIASANEMSVDELAVHVATTFRVPVAQLDTVSPYAVSVLEEKVARQYLVIPLRKDERKLVVACSDPTDLDLEQALRFASRRTIEFEVAPPKAIRRAIEWWYGGKAPR